MSPADLDDLAPETYAAMVAYAVREQRAQRREARKAARQRRG